MEENKKKRGWVKDAAIIFLAVLLVLTFFSNTILNRSLPEVATVNVQDGTITNKVRGTGTVTARENYDVTIDQTKTVQSVLVRVGDEVAVGDVLFTLQAGDSDELEAAEKQLKNLEKNYQRSLLNAAEYDYARNDREINYAREDLEDAQAALEEAQITPEELAEYESDLAELEAEIAELEDKIEAQEAVVDEFKAGVETENGSLRDLELQMRELKDELAEKKKVVRAKQEVVDEKQIPVDEAQEKLNDAIAERSDYQDKDPSFAPVRNALNALNDAERATAAALQDLEVAKVVNRTGYDKLVREANYMEYDYKVYEIRADVESKYRADHGIGVNAVLTPAQVSDVDQQTDRRAVSKLGERDAYVAENQSIYISAAAANVAPGSDMAAAYAAVSAAEKVWSDKANAEQQRRIEYNAAYSDYYESLAESDLYHRYDRAVTAAEKALEEAKKPLEAAKKELNTANQAVDRVNLAISDLQEVINRANSEQLGDRNSDLSKAESVLSDLKSDLKTAENDKDALENDMDARKQEVKTRTQAVRTAQDKLSDLLFNLEQQKKSDGKSQILEAMNLQEQLEEIEEQREYIAELIDEDSGTEVTSQVYGKVETLSVSAGHKAEAGKVLATIEVPDLGYSMSFSVTNEQAKKLRVGDTASVSNFYWGSTINATLVSMQTDPQNPQGGKLLNFDVTGDVTAGNSLTISIGEKNANYDMVVPNSAVRSDTNGSFVLMVTAKNSPLGNRYFATRVNVEVIASDDQYSAISGAIEKYDTVITTASRNAPISSGDQVRLADSN